MLDTLFGLIVYIIIYLDELNCMLVSFQPNLSLQTMCIVALLIINLAVID